MILNLFKLIALEFIKNYPLIKPNFFFFFFFFYIKFSICIYFINSMNLFNYYICFILTLLFSLFLYLILILIFFFF